MFKKQARLGASAMPFAHLIAGFMTPSASDEDEDPKAEEGDEDPKTEVEDAPKSKKAKKAAKAEDEDGEDDDGDIDAEEDDDAPKSKKAKRATEDEDEEQAAARAAGAKAERARWTKVMGSEAAGGQALPLACQMLSTTNLSASVIIANLQAVPQSGSASGLYGRMSQNRTPNIGGGNPDAVNGAKPQTPAQMAAAILGAGAKSRGLGPAASANPQTPQDMAAAIRAAGARAGR